MPEKHQSHEEMSSGAGAAPGGIENAARAAERASGAGTRQAAGTQHEQATPEGEAPAATGGAAAARERVSVYTAPARTARERITEAIHYVRTANSTRFSEDAKEFVRRHPGTLAGAVLAGYVFGRIMRRL
jgi:hypothetical protein